MCVSRNEQIFWFFSAYFHFAGLSFEIYFRFAIILMSADPNNIVMGKHSDYDYAERISHGMCIGGNGILIEGILEKTSHWTPKHSSIHFIDKSMNRFFRRFYVKIWIYRLSKCTKEWLSQRNKQITKSGQIIWIIHQKSVSSENKRKEITPLTVILISLTAHFFLIAYYFADAWYKRCPLTWHQNRRPRNRIHQIEAL